MNEQQRGREYLADLLGLSPAEVEETLNGIVWPVYRHPAVEAVRQLEAAERRGPDADVVIRDDVVDDGPPWRWWKSLRAQQHGVGLLPTHLLPDRIRYAPELQTDRHHRSVQQWAAEQERDRGRRVPAMQQLRLAKFLDDWTRP